MDECKMYKDGMSIPVINKLTGTPMSNLRYKFKKAGILRSRIQGIILASKEGRLGSGLRGKKRVFTNEWKKKISESKIQQADKNAKGVSLKPSGYYEHTRGENKGRSVHIVIVEKSIGRRLFKNEVVHHINHIKTDNRIENLQVMTRSEHATHHANDTLKNRVRDNKGRFK